MFAVSGTLGDPPVVCASYHGGMPLSAPLYERAVSAPPVPAGLPLVMALTGFTDAGSAVSGVVDYLRE